MEQTSRGFRQCRLQARPTAARCTRLEGEAAQDGRRLDEPPGDVEEPERGLHSRSAYGNCGLQDQSPNVENGD
jgi:hypothetical protein